MNLEYYPLKASQNKKRYDFISKGPMGNIRKTVKFRKMGQNYFALAFGDWDKEKRMLDSQVRSNNGDRDIILSTVAHAVFKFLDYFEDAIITIEGETKARTRLYQMAINKYFKVLAILYRIQGIENGILEEFQPGKNYEGFFVCKKAK